MRHFWLFVKAVYPQITTFAFFQSNSYGLRTGGFTTVQSSSEVFKSPYCMAILSGFKSWFFRLPAIHTEASMEEFYDSFSSSVKER